MNQIFKINGNSEYVGFKMERAYYAYIYICMAVRVTVIGTLHLNKVNKVFRPTGFGQYHSLGEYCGPHTASSVFLILVRDPFWE